MVDGVERLVPLAPLERATRDPPEQDGGVAQVAPDDQVSEQVRGILLPLLVASPRPRAVAALEGAVDEDDLLEGHPLHGIATVCLSGSGGMGCRGGRGRRAARRPAGGRCPRTHHSRRPPQSLGDWTLTLGDLQLF